MSMPFAEVDIIETGGRGRERAFVSLLASVLVLERLCKERFERGLVCPWVDVAHKDEAAEWVWRGGCGLRLRLGLDLGVDVRVGGGFAALAV